MSKKTFSSKEAFEYYENEKSIAEAARKYCEAVGLEYTQTSRKNLSAYINKHDLKNKNNDLENETITETDQYCNDKESEESFFMPSAWNSDLNKFLSIEEYCEQYGLPKDQVRSSKLVSHVSNHMVYNIAFNPVIHEQAGINEEFISEIVKSHIKPVNYFFNTDSISNEDFFDRCVMTDIHLNMDPSGEKNTVPMYQHTWNKKDIFKRLDLTIQHITNHKKSNTIVIDELGDLMDGLKSQTTRGGHHLPQETSDKDAFKLGIDFKMYIIDRLVVLYENVIMNNITNDNHSFLFGYFVNESVKKIVDIKYPNKVKYNILQRFIEHYVIGKHTFILSHGKDSGEKKFGFKATYDPKAADVIDNYCKSHSLYDGNFIEFSMGDQHQRIFDTTSNNDFSYCAYGAFSPPSNWVGTNFKDTASSIDFFNIHREQNLKINIPLIF